MRILHSLSVLFFLSLPLSACATSGDASDDEYADAQSDATLPGKIDLWQSTDDQWRFHVVSGNGRTLLTSEGYTSRTGALGGVLSVLDNGVDPLQYQVNQTANGYNVRLRAGNYEIIAITQTYATKYSAERGVTSCVRAITSYLDRAQGNTSGARVDVFATASGYHFNLHAQNGESVLSSETYTTAAAAWNGAFAIQDASALEGAFAIKTATDGRYYFTLTAENGQVVGVSQLYTTKESAQGGVAAVKSLLADMDLI